MSPTSPLRTMRAFILRFSGMFAGSARDNEMAAEFESHLEMQIEDNLRAGMTPTEARRNALLKTGGPVAGARELSQSPGLPFLDTILRDLQYAGRLLRRSPRSQSSRSSR